MREGVETKMKENSPQKKARKLLLGTMLGDSYMNCCGDKKARLVMSHSNRNLDYLLWKAKILFPLVGSFTFSQFSRGYSAKGGFFKIWLRTLCSKYLKHIHNDFYRKIGGRWIKVVRENVLNRLTPISLASWYGDDGCLVVRRKYGREIPVEVRIATQGFTFDECIMICDMLKRNFGLDFHVGNCYSRGVWTRHESMNEFLRMVSPYLMEVKSMRYKLSPQYDKPSFDSARHPVNLLDDDIVRTLLRNREEARNSLPA